MESRDHLFKTFHFPCFIILLAHVSIIQLILLLLNEFQSNILSNVMYFYN